MTMYTLKSKRFPDRKAQILDDDHMINLKKLKMEKRYVITETKPLRQVPSPLAPEVIEVKNPKQKNK